MQNTVNKSTAYAVTLQRKNNKEGSFQTFLHSSNSPEKTEIECFIRDTYSTHYKAQILHFYPYLFGAYDEKNQPYAAIGYRFANEQRLFLEQYFDRPIENILRNLAEEQCEATSLERKHIVEVGNLAATKQGACRKLIKVLALSFHRSNNRWIVLTGTRVVRLILKRMHLKYYNLTTANADALKTSSKKSWGSYYEKNPVVIAIPISQGLPDPLKNYAIT